MPRELEREDYTVLSPVDVELNGENGFSVENIKTGIPPSDVHKVMENMNNYIVMYNDKLELNFPDAVMGHVNTGVDEASEHMVFVQCQRQSKTGTRINTNNPLTGLAIAEIISKNGKQYARFSKLAYYLGEDDPVELNSRMNPYVPRKLIPLDPKRFTPALLIKVACDLLETDDEAKIKIAMEQLFRLFEFFVKGQNTGEVWGRYATATKFQNRIKVFFLFMKFNTNFLGLAEIGVNTFRQADLITLEAQDSIINACQALLDEFTLESGRPSKKARNQIEQDAGGEPEGEVEYEDEEIQEPIFPNCDGQNGYPLPKVVYEFNLEARPANEAAAGGDADVKLPLIELRERDCPYRKAIQKLGNEEVFRADITQKLVHLTERVIREASTVLRYSGRWERELVVWNVDLQDEQKSALQELRGAFQAICKANAEHSIFFAKLPCTFGPNMLADVLEQLVTSREVTQLLLRRLDNHNERIVDAYLKSRHFYPLFFSLLHGFIVDFVKLANEQNKKLLKAQRYKIESQPEFPKKHMLVVLYYDVSNDEEASEACERARILFSKPDILARISMHRTIYEVEDCLFTVGAIWDDEEGFVVIVRQLLFANVPRVFETDDTVKDRSVFPTYVSTTQDSLLLKIENVVTGTLQYIISGETDTGIRDARVLSVLSSETAVSVWMNFIRKTHFLESLFNWSEPKADALLVAIVDPPVVEDDLTDANIGDVLTAKLKQIGDTDYLKLKLSWIKTAELRALALASLMPFRVIEGEGSSAQVETIRIPICTIKEKRLRKNAHFLESAAQDLEPRPQNCPCPLSEYFTHDIFLEAEADA